MGTFAVKGTLLYSETSQTLCVCEEGYWVCVEGLSKGVYETLPEQYQQIPVYDYTGHLILPGLSDIHLHAPQYGFRGLGMDQELLDWLNTYTFPEEQKFADLAYAEKVYKDFAEALLQAGTTRVCVFATIHREATLLLMQILEEQGVCGYVGKVNMDRNCPQELVEENSIKETEKILKEAKKFHKIRPILTPRFIPSCSDSLMREIGKLQAKYHLPLQSHLSENLSEMQWVQELVPDSTCYGDAYDRFGTFGSAGKTIMAHCIHSSEEEVQLMKERNVIVAHCPQSNINLASGIAPVRRYLEEGIRVGLGSDIAGGHSLSILRAMADAIQVSKLRWRLLDQQARPLSVEEAFYLGTVGGGSVFGKVGSFQEGYEFDGVVFDDRFLCFPEQPTPKQRLERLIYLGDQVAPKAIFVKGEKIR